MEPKVLVRRSVVSDSSNLSFLFHAHQALLIVCLSHSMLLYWKRQRLMDLMTTMIVTFHGDHMREYQEDRMYSPSMRYSISPSFSKYRNMDLLHGRPPASGARNYSSAQPGQVVRVVRSADQNESAPVKMGSLKELWIWTYLSLHLISEAAEAN